MNYKINKKDQKPAYIQLYELIKNDIMNSIYVYNSKLPSKRLLSEELHLSIITVEHAYQLLCDEGYIEPKQRRGYFVIFKHCDFFTQNNETIHPIPNKNKITYTSYQFPQTVLTKTMRNVMSEYGSLILEKSPNAGCPVLKDAICTYLEQNRGIKVSNEQIIIGSGAEYLYRLIIELFGRNTILAIENPSYEKIRQVYESCGATIDLLPFDKDGINSLSLKNTNATLLHISPYRSFPTGISASASKRYEYLRWADSNQRYIIEDDFESEFSISKKNEETLFSLSKNDNVIYINTFSQTIGAGLRIGYMVLPNKIVSLFNEKLGFYSCTVPTFEQYVLAALLNNGDFQRHINRVRRLKRKHLKKNK